MEREVLEKFSQYCFVKNDLYKEFYITPENDRGMFVDTSDDENTGFDKAVYVKFMSIGTLGKNGPMHHVGEHAYFRMYLNKDGRIELLFENNGHIDEVISFKHMMYLLDPTKLDLQN